MKVLVLQGLAGNGKGYPIQKGEQELPDNVAIDLIRRGLAESLQPIQQAERAINVPKVTKRKK